MAIRFACPVCKTPYTVKNRDAGKKADCKKCGQRLQVPAPPRSKTLLGEVLPEANSAGAPVPPSRPAMGRLEPDPNPRASSGPSASGAGPIRFACPGCGAAYTVNRVSAGKSMDCRSCGHTMTVPGNRDEPLPSPQPAALPVAPFDEREEPAPPPPPEPEPEPEPETYFDYPRSRRAAYGPANRVVAGVGAGLLFIGLFLPMIHGPLGFWMSFVDFPWKAITVGFAIADEIKNAEPRRDPSDPRDPTPPTARPDNDRGKAAKEPDGAALAVLVAIGSVLYPIFILAILAFTGFQIACGRTAAAYLFAGVCCAGATLLYGLAILMLNAVPELRLVMAMLSPGFGWAVLFIGSFMLMVSGMIHPTRQE